MDEIRDSDRTPDPEPADGGAGGPTFRAPGVDTGEPGGGGMPGVLRFFVVPLVLVGVSLAVFAGLGALVGQGPPAAEDLVARIAGGGKNARWQAAQELSNQVFRGEADLVRDERLAGAVAAAFRKARAEGDDPRILQHLSVLLGRSSPSVARPVLEEALADGNPDTRIFVVAALDQMGDPASLPSLLPRLEDLDAGVRAVAAYAAAGLARRPGAADPAGARAALAKALGDPAVEVRWNAALGLARLGDAAGADLVWSMLHRDYVRANLQRGDGAGGPGLLSPRGSDPVTPAEREEAVILNALSAAHLLADRSMIEGVRALAGEDPSDAVRDWAMRAREGLEREIREKGAVPPRTWSAAR